MTREQEHKVRQQARQAANNDDDLGRQRSKERAEWWVGHLSHELGIVDSHGMIDVHGEVARAFVRAYLRAPREAWPTPDTSGTSPQRRLGFSEARIVRDFNTLDDLVDHAARDLGATHVSGAGPTTKLYFPRGGTHPYEEAKIWRKGGYWHAEWPGARTGVKNLPKDAQPIGGRAGRRAAEAHERPGTAWETWKRAVINDLERSVPRLEATRIFDRYRHEMAVRFRNGEKPSDMAHNFLSVWQNETLREARPRKVEIRRSTYRRAEANRPKVKRSVRRRR